MTIEITENRQSVEDSAELSARKAQAFFISASMRAPSSVTAQAAIIAELCRANSLNPNSLKDILKGREDILEQLREQAQQRHGKAKKGPTMIPLESLKHIVIYDFQFAGTLLRLSDDVLRNIYTERYQYYHKGEGLSLGSSEEQFKVEVINLIGGTDLYTPARL